MRNSSLVKCSCADNVTGLKPAPEAVGVAFGGAVGERSQCSEAAAASDRGALGSENAGISNERGVRNSSTGCPRFPEEGSSAQG